MLGACSATRLVYSQLDWIIVWYLNGYFSLDEAQEAQLRDAVGRNLDWHRRTQLPEYATFCRQLQRDSAGVLTAESLSLRYARLIDLWDATIRHAMPDIAAFLRSLSDGQIDEFVGNLEEHNRELWDEYAGETAEERRKRRERAAFKGFRRAIGRLTAEQKELIRAYMANMHDVSAYWIESRRKWQRDLRDALLEGRSEPEFRVRLGALLLDPNRTDDRTYRQKVDENRETFFAMTIALSGALTDRQRGRFGRRMSKFARNFEILSVREI